jgi:hypothetical protein
MENGVLRPVRISERKRAAVDRPTITCPLVTIDAHLGLFHLVRLVHEHRELRGGDPINHQSPPLQALPLSSLMHTPTILGEYAVQDATPTVGKTSRHFVRLAR